MWKVVRAQSIKLVLVTPCTIRIRFANNMLKIRKFSKHNESEEEDQITPLPPLLQCVQVEKIAALFVR
jgi:hypothetical protein